MLLNPSASVAQHRRGRPLGRQRLKTVEFRALGEDPLTDKILLRQQQKAFHSTIQILLGETYALPAF